MTLEQLYMWHREQSERFYALSREHKTTGSRTHRDAVKRRYEKQAHFHLDAAELLRGTINTKANS